MAYNRGDVVDVDLTGSVGHEPANDEQAGSRPCLVVQNDKGNSVSPTTIVVSLTGAAGRKRIHTHVFVSGEELGAGCKDSLICCEYPMVIDLQRVKGPRTKVSGETMKKVDEKLRLSLQL